MARWRRRHHRKGWLYVAPALVLFGLMVLYPIARSFQLSFYDFSFLAPDDARFVGAGNYVKLVEEQANRKPFWNTLYFAVLFTPPYVIVALVLALLLNRVRRGAVFLRTLIFIPVVVSLAVSAVLWTLFYNASFGMAHRVLLGACHFVNHLPAYAATYVPPYLVALGAVLAALVVAKAALSRGWRFRRVVWAAALLALLLCAAVGVLWHGGTLGAWRGTLLRAAPGLFASLNLVSAPREGVLGNPDWAMPAIVLVCIWNGVGVNVILFLVGLQRIPEELYEAAEVDGAKPRQRFWHVTVPQLAPTTYLVILLSMIGAFKIFGQPFIMTQGGPMDSTRTFVMRLYDLAFVYGRFELGYASALAFALAAFIFVMTLFVRRLNRPVE